MIEEIIVPSPGESITEVELTRWLVSDGDLVKKDQEIAEVDSDKATLTITAALSGKIKIEVLENERIPVGKKIGSIDTSIDVPDSDIKKISDETNVFTEKSSIKQKITPLAKEVMAKNHIENKELNNIGANKRITKEDVFAILQKEKPLKPEDNRAVEIIKMSMLRKKIAERLVAVKNETAMLTTFNEIDLSRVIHIRNKYKDSFFEKHGVKLSYMSFFGIAVIKSLHQHPAVNSRIEIESIVIPSYVDLCIAISTAKGLIAPPLRDADKLSFVQIEKAIAALAQKARENKLSIDELTGGTFTITNGGVFGSMMSTPILNPPQAAILGMHKVMDRPVAIDKKIEIRPMMYVALSYDHRIIDGKESVGFLLKVKEILENPEEYIFEGKSIENGLILA